LAATNLDLLNKVSDRCTSLGAPSSHVFQLFADDVASCESLVKFAVDTLGGIDVLVLNHCLGLYKPINVESPGEAIETVRKCAAINHVAYVALAHHALPIMAKSAASPAASPSPASAASPPLQPHILVLGSLSGCVPVPNVHAYAASKAAVQTYFACMATELAQRKHPVRVSVAILGAIGTESFFGSNVSEKTAKLAASPRECAETVVRTAATSESPHPFYYPPSIAVLPLIYSISPRAVDAIVAMTH
jgi:short-subunit dehydrogenase